MSVINHRLVSCLVIIFLGLLIGETRSQTPWADGNSRGEDLVIKLATFGPGEEITTFFGHTALIVEDKRQNASRLYNFGLFSIGKNFLMNFARGRLIFWAGDARVGPTLLRYASEDRDIIIQTLDLTAEQKLHMANTLHWWVQPGNNSYLYHHYLNNCATIPRDIIDDALGGIFADHTSVPSEMTYRDFTIRYTAHLPGLMVLLMFLMNDSIDKPIENWDAMFLPLELADNVRTLTLKDSTGGSYPFVSREIQHFKSSRPPVPERVPGFTVELLLLGLLLGILPVILSYYVRKKYRIFKPLFGFYNVFLGLLFGIPGFALLLMSLFTDHQVTYYNENVLLANPVTLFAAIVGLVWLFQRSLFSKTLYYAWLLLTCSSLLLILLKFFPAFDQANTALILLIFPVNAGFLLSHHLLKLRQKDG